MTSEQILLLALRLAMVLLLYLFIIWVVRTLAGDLRATARRLPPRNGSAPGRLVLLDGVNGHPSEGHTVAVQRETTIGRAEDNSVILDDEFISAHHAVLRYDGDWWIADSGSTNGTWVDGERVEGARQVQSGAMVQFGRLRARFES